MDKINLMIAYLGYMSYPIPSAGLSENAFPVECRSKENWRPEQNFVLHKSGDLTYCGWRERCDPIVLYGLKPSDQMLGRAHRMLAEECVQKAHRKSVGSGSNINKAMYLLLRFNGLDFLRKEGRIKYRQI